MACPARHVEKQWRHVKQVFSPQLGVRVEHILGNHDIWGIDRDRSQTTGSEALYGKKWAMQVLGLDRTYRSFDEGGWHWILLDDVMGVPEKKIYEGLLDETQFAWLVADLLQTPSSTPVIVLTHVPILGASVFFPPQCTHKRSWDLPFSMMHADANRLLALFEQHDNVRLCLSGHTHLVDEVKYKGITYLCNGAVCGNWWMGNFQGFRPGYSMIDLHSDGTFASQYMTYDAA
jgi:3',5'-cyclic AMP phosphodiesterase CpdA